MASITIIDPVTRIEGHMKVEISIETVGGVRQIVDARCTGTLFRDFETLLQGRHPWDAPLITERICGVCPVSHGQASVLALDAAAGKTSTTNGRILRNLVLGANYIQSHILHFYLLTAFDFVRGPQSAPWTPAWDVDIRGGREVAIMDHLGDAIAARRKAHEMGALFGGKLPAPASYIPGGFTATPSRESIDRFRKMLSELTLFIEKTYIPDVKLLTETYSDYFGVGAGCGKLLAFGAFEQNDAGTSKLFSSGYAAIENPTRINTLSMDSITESVAYSWYADSTDGLSPRSGATEPRHPKGAAYSWLKAPRYLGNPYETGPLARMWMTGEYRRGVSVMDRNMARAQEALKVARAMNGWLDGLDPNGPVFNTDFNRNTPSTGTGVGLTEAPRGALGHWVDVSGGKITRYQIITPTCWNASPRDRNGVPGPMEQALIGTPITDPEQPIEALRVIHSFDPCLSCAVHIMRPKGKPVVINAVCR